MKTVTPPGWSPAKGYANAVVADGGTIYLAGMIGWNSDQIFECEDFVGQLRQALQNIVDVLAAAGARPEHIVRMTWFVADRQEYLDALPEVGASYRDVVGRHFPAMSVLEVKGFVEETARLEIEATAVLPSAAVSP
jgi:enamine deaminase RidA (YjgF/YER057c/UK114 family)